MALTPARLLGLSLLGLGVWAGGCRELSVCSETESCESSAEGGAPPQTGAAPNAGADDAPGQTGQPAAGGASGGEAAIDGDGGVGPSPGCELGFDECDGSSLTACETAVIFDTANCGGCDDACEGACVLGRCKASEVIEWEGRVRELVAGSTLAYALFFTEGAWNVVEIELDSGSTRVVGTGFSEKARLALAGDRLFALDGTKLSSRGPSDAAFEQEPISPAIIGGSAGGLYYVERVYDPDPRVETDTLFYRAVGASEAIVLRRGYVEILASDRVGVAARWRTANVSQKLLFLDGKRVVDLGTMPGAESVYTIRDGVAALVHNVELPSGYELHLLRINDPEEIIPLQFEVKDPSLVRAPGGVALLLRDRRSPFVQSFGDGREAIAFGLDAQASLLLVDSQYLWFTTRTSASATPTFRRAKHLEPSDSFR